MDLIFIALGEVVFSVQAVMPRGPLIALPPVAVVWLIAWRTQRLPGARPAVALVRLWAAMLGLSCAALLLAWFLDSHTTDSPYWRLGRGLTEVLVMTALAGPVYALRFTVASAFSRWPHAGSRLGRQVSAAAWIVFSAVVLLCVHAMLMSAVFPWGGGEFHAMFAYTSQGRLGAALSAWRASVFILGLAAVAFPVWVPLRWWVITLLAILVGVDHWWAVYAWRPQSPGFHRAVTWLLFAMPVVILLLSGAGAWLRRLWLTRHHRHPPRPSE